MTAIISDIHGNLPALESVLGKIDQMGIETVYSLGDVAGYYSMINECIRMLADRGISNILGNHDHYLINNVGSGRSSKVDFAISYQRKIITPENFSWLKSSATSISNTVFFAVHGGMNDYLDEYVYDYSFPLEIPQKFFFTAHTHIPFIFKKGDKTHANPGSVGQPRDHDPRASFAVLDKSGNIEILRVEYDIDKTDFNMKKAGFPKEFTENLYKGIRIGG
ncbi:MAG: metallophosphoesterase family protein [Ruminococcaceae bacterium]|nr:metallophosphoesterase family protein [Oscillospiraceae bacterium]